MQNTQYIYIYISIIIANLFGYVLVTEDDINVQKEIMHILKFYENALKNLSMFLMFQNFKFQCLMIFILT